MRCPGYWGGRDNVSGSGKSRMSLSSMSQNEDLQDSLNVLLVIRCCSCS